MGLHPSDVERIQLQLERFVMSGNTVVIAEHDMQVIANCDWVIEMGRERVSSAAVRPHLTLPNT